MAGLNSYGETIIEEQISSRDHTENFLKNKHIIQILKNRKKLIKINGKKNINSFDINVSGDLSAAFHHPNFIK